MINKETILSNYNDRLTLLQWLKKVELALQNASAKEFRVNKLGNATLTFSIVFDDDTELTTGPIVLEQGESVESAAIVNGHLILTLTNGDVLDCGELLNGNVNINGTLNATKVTGGEIVETMTGYSYITETSSGVTITYAGVCKNGNKITFVVAGTLQRNENTPYSPYAGSFLVPAEISNKIYPIGETMTISASQLAFVDMAAYATQAIVRNVQFYKEQSNPNRFTIQMKAIDSTFALNTTYTFRYECTFLLSDNLAA